MADRKSVIAAAISRLESGAVQLPASMGQDPAALADTLREGARSGSARRFAAFKTAQRIVGEVA